MFCKPTFPTFSLGFALLFGAVLFALSPTLAAAAEPDWPDNATYQCIFQLNDGTVGAIQTTFSRLPKNSHKFGDGNELKRGKLQGGTRPPENVTLAYKPRELPPTLPGHTRFEFTLNDRATQCKSFQVQTVRDANLCIETFTVKDCDATLAHLRYQTCQRFFSRQSADDC